MLDKIRNWYNDLPEKKKWMDLVTAVLTIPVLLTVIITNLGNLKRNKDQAETVKNPEPTVERIIIRENGVITAPPADGETGKSTPTPGCSRNLPGYEISYPGEGDKVDIDPVCVSLTSQTEGNFCPVVWAYSINKSSWSTYSDDPICLYNMAPGQIRLDVKIKSTASGEEKTFTRNFIYGSTQAVSPTPTATPITPSITP